MTFKTPRPAAAHSAQLEFALSLIDAELGKILAEIAPTNPKELITFHLKNLPTLEEQFVAYQTLNQAVALAEKHAEDNIPSVLFTYGTCRDYCETLKKEIDFSLQQAKGEQKKSDLEAKEDKGAISPVITVVIKKSISADLKAEPTYKTPKPEHLEENIAVVLLFIDRQIAKIIQRKPPCDVNHILDDIYLVFNSLRKTQDFYRGDRNAMRYAIGLVVKGLQSTSLPITQRLHVKLSQFLSQFADSAAIHEDRFRAELMTSKEKQLPTTQRKVKLAEYALWEFGYICPHALSLANKTLTQVRKTLKWDRDEDNIAAINRLDARFQAGIDKYQPALSAKASEPIWSGLLKRLGIRAPTPAVVTEASPTSHCAGRDAIYRV